MTPTVECGAYSAVVNRTLVSDMERLERVFEQVPSVRACGDPSRRGGLLELEGLGAEVWRGVDPLEYVAALRDEWDSH